MTLPIIVVSIATVIPAYGSGAAREGFWEAFFGLVFGGPLGALVVGGTAAAVGAVTGKLSDIGIDDNFIKQVAEPWPGSSAIFPLVIKSTPDRELDALSQYHDINALAEEYSYSLFQIHRYTRQAGVKES